MSPSIARWLAAGAAVSTLFVAIVASIIGFDQLRQAAVARQQAAEQHLANRQQALELDRRRIQPSVIVSMEDSGAGIQNIVGRRAPLPALGLTKTSQCASPFSRVDELVLSAVLDWAVFQEVHYVRVYNLHDAAKAISEIEKRTKTWTEGTAGLKVLARNGVAKDHAMRLQRQEWLRAQGELPPERKQPPPKRRN